MKTIVYSLIWMIVGLNIMLPASIALFEEQKPALEYSSMNEFFEQQEKFKLQEKFHKKQVQCLASVVYHEARGEPLIGQVAVAQVVMNRVKSNFFPNTVCKVAFQYKQFTGLYRIKFNKTALKIAERVYLGKNSFKTIATHYHADYVDPYWASSEKKIYLGKIGRHIFYKAKWA